MTCACGMQSCTEAKLMQPTVCSVLIAADRWQIIGASFSAAPRLDAECTVL
jgi:hypothetical protein